MFAQEYMDYLLQFVSKMPERYQHDVIADVIVHVSDNGVDLDEHPDPKRYLRNRAAEMLSKNKRYDRCLPLLYDVADAQQEESIFKLRVEDVMPAIESMPEKLQSTFHKLLEGKTVEQIAAEEDLTLFAIWSRIRKIRKAVSAWSKRYFPDMDQLL